MSLRDQILKATDLKPEPIDTPADWGDAKLFIRRFSAKTRRDLAKWFTGKGGEKNVTQFDMEVRLVTIGLCDESGARVFADDDEPLLAEKNALSLHLIAEAVMHLNGMDEGAREGLLKNSRPTPSGISLSA